MNPVKFHNGWIVVICFIITLALGGYSYNLGQQSIIAEGQRAGYILPISEGRTYSWNIKLKEDAAANKEVILVPIGAMKFLNILSTLTNAPDLSIKYKDVS
jgi:hypothetical protein